MISRCSISRPRNQERLLRLNPSAIFVYHTVADSLRRVGLPALGLTQPSSPADVFDRTRVFAAALGQDKDDLIEAFRTDLDSVSHQLDTPPPQQPAVTEIFLLPTGTILLIGRNEADRAAFDAAAVVNAAPSERTIRIGIETMLRLNPDIILLLQKPSPEPTSFMQDAHWQALRAVQRRTVYRRPLGANGGFEGIVEFPLFAQWLAELAHPERLPPQLRLRIRQKIEHLFRYTLSPQQIDDFLDVAENHASAGYGRFEQ